MCNCVLPVTLNSTKVRHLHRIEDKHCCEGEKQGLTSEANDDSGNGNGNGNDNDKVIGLNLTSSPATATSSPANSGCRLRRGRSRTRRPLPPSSPLIIASSVSS